MDVIEAPFRSAVDRRSASDRAHVGDIVGAMGTVASHDVGPRRSLRRRLVTLAAVMGPGLIVMAADNDAGSLSVYAQAGQNHGLGLVWILVLLAPALIVNQEMAVRLGAVTGAGHARLIVERFGRTWGAFALGDLLIVNLLMIVTEFIGVTLALGYFGVSRYVAVPIAAAALMAVTSTGSFRRWERAMYVLIATNVLMVPLVLLARSHVGAGAGAGLVPSVPGDAGSLLLVLALVGATVAPWQLFFQQSNVVDKRITARWLRYERVDTVIGAVIVIAGGCAVMFAAASLHGSGAGFKDAGAVAAGLGAGSGQVAGALFAVVLFNASILGAAAVTLASSYAIGDYAGLKHSLHRKWRDAPVFYGSYVAAVSLGAAVVLVPGARLGIVTTSVQALAGVLLPSAVVFLLLLCNDREVLGPWTNPRWLNMLGVSVVTVLIVLSGTLTVTTVFPHADPALVASVIAALGAVALALWAYAMWGARHESIPDADTPWQRATWTMPWSERIGPPGATRVRAVGLVVLRAYLLGAAALVVVKAIQLAVGG
ncbi:MAG TPA: NRAMP family divalent metal transporter [Solirubrobacteraceae bacterium]|nr:NRAMP family divalent metal transporter [Solirubrobacteraceae bacterium]